MEIRENLGGDWECDLTDYIQDKYYIGENPRNRTYLYPRKSKHNTIGIRVVGMTVGSLWLNKDNTVKKITIGEQSVEFDKFDKSILNDDFNQFIGEKVDLVNIIPFRAKISCRGSMMFGTGCGKCYKCSEELERIRRS